MKLFWAIIIIICLSSAFLLFRFVSMENRRVAIGTTGLTVEIPKYLTIKQEESDILLAYIGGSNLANIRFTVLDSLKGIGSTRNSFDTATKSQPIHLVYRLGDKTVNEWEQPAAHEVDSTMRYWHVDYGKKSFLVSCYYANDNKDNPLTEKALGSVANMILSINIQK